MEQYYTGLRKTLLKIENAISDILSKNIDEYSETDYNYILGQLHYAKLQAQRLLTIHKYYRMSAESFIKNGDLGTEILHTVKSYENIADIAKRHGIAVEYILNYNHITTNEITAGTVLKIRLKSKTNDNNVDIDSLPVYANNVEGKEILGRDVGINLEIGESGDLSILEPEETLIQGIMNNVLTEKGNYPTENDFGVGYYRDLLNNPELAVNLWKIKTKLFLESDYRIAGVRSVDILKEEGAYKIKVNADTINNESLEIVI